MVVEKFIQTVYQLSHATYVMRGVEIIRNIREKCQSCMQASVYCDCICSYCGSKEYCECDALPQPILP